MQASKLCDLNFELKVIWVRIKAHGACHIKCWGLSVLPTAIWLTAIIEPNPSVDYHNRTALLSSCIYRVNFLQSKQQQIPRTPKKKKKRIKVLPSWWDKMALKGITLCHVREYSSALLCVFHCRRMQTNNFLKLNESSVEVFNAFVPPCCHSCHHSKSVRKRMRTLWPETMPYSALMPSSMGPRSASIVCLISGKFGAFSWFPRILFALCWNSTIDTLCQCSYLTTICTIWYISCAVNALPWRSIRSNSIFTKRLTGLLAVQRALANTKIALPLFHFWFRFWFLAQYSVVLALSWSQRHFVALVYSCRQQTQFECKRNKW